MGRIKITMTQLHWVLLLFACESCLSQIPNILWSRNYGGYAVDGFGSFILTRDSCFLIVGATSTDTISGFSGQSDGWVVKTDLDGKVLWQRCYGGDSIDRLVACIQLHDGNYVLAGTTMGDITNYHGHIDAWLVKIDSTGNVIWSYAYGGTAYEELSSIVESDNGSIVILGTANSEDGDVSPNGYNMDFWLVKINSNGQILWDKSYGQDGSEFGNSIYKTKDGNYMLCGGASGGMNPVCGQNGNPSFWLVCVDSLGSLLWQRCYGGSRYEEPFKVIESLDGGFVLVGQTISVNGDISDTTEMSFQGWIVKTDTLGNLEWEKTLGSNGIEKFNSVIATTDTTYLLLGYTNSNDISGFNGNTDYYLAKLDNNGKVLWEYCFGGTLDEFPHTILQIEPNCYVISGGTESSNGDITTSYGYVDGWLLKFKEPTISKILEVGQTNFTLYPNPVNSSITFEKLPTGSKLTIYNIQGHVYQDIEIKQPKLTLDIQALPAGHYFCKVTNDQQHTTKRFLVE